MARKRWIWRNGSYYKVDVFMHVSIYHKWISLCCTLLVLVNLLLVIANECNKPKEGDRHIDKGFRPRHVYPFSITGVVAFTNPGHVQELYDPTLMLASHSCTATECWWDIHFLGSFFLESSTAMN